MFFAPKAARGSFVLHFAENPILDFGIWARGYYEAADRLCESLLAERGFGDKDAYPVAFLYRHSLELYLKGVIVRANHLVGLRDDAEFCEQLKSNHRLLDLFATSKRLLERSFPGDSGLDELISKLEIIVSDLNAVDPGSFSFRYPVDRTFARPEERHTVVGLVELRAGMMEILEALDSVDTALQVEGDNVEEALSYLYHDES